MAEQPIVLSVLFESLPGSEKDLAAQLIALTASTRKEPGCLGYELNYDPESPLRFMLYEKFSGQTALDEHIAAPHFQEFLSYRAVGTDPVALQVVTRLAPLA